MVPSSDPSELAATVDLGTNTVLLLVARKAADGRLLPVHESAQITRLGEGVHHQRKLAEGAKRRTLAACDDYARIMDQMGVSQRVAIGTSALRDATDGESFRLELEHHLGCRVEIINGKREAELILAGVQSTFGSLGPERLVFDIGGGSTELIIPGRSDQQTQVVSLNLGSVRLTEMHVRHDPPAAAEIEAVRHTVRTTLAQLPQLWRSRPFQLIGVAGTLTTLAAVAQGLASYDSARVDGCTLTNEEISNALTRFIALSYAQRCEIAGLDPRRADVIIAGATLAEEILRYFGAVRCRVSDRGVRWGRIAELF
jgi:exopolyphosphatase/guanosine-5'-triphosphate,3'-diphosphate pyrophosphatase